MKKGELKETILEVIEPFMADVKGEFDGVRKRFEQNDREHVQMRNEMSRMNNEMSRMRNEMSRINNEMLDGFDKVLKSIEDIKTDNIANQAAHARFSENLENHEARIGVLEAGTKGN